MIKRLPRQLLERREQQMDIRSQKPLIVELYDEMRKYMDKGTELMPVFLKMLESLRYSIVFDLSVKTL